MKKVLQITAAAGLIALVSGGLRKFVDSSIHESETQVIQKQKEVMGVRHNIQGIAIGQPTTAEVLEFYKMVFRKPIYSSEDLQRIRMNKVKEFFEKSHSEKESRKNLSIIDYFEENGMSPEDLKETLRLMLQGGSLAAFDVGVRLVEVEEGVKPFRNLFDKNVTVKNFDQHRLELELVSDYFKDEFSMPEENYKFHKYVFLIKWAFEQLDQLILNEEDESFEKIDDTLLNEMQRVVFFLEDIYLKSENVNESIEKLSQLLEMSPSELKDKILGTIAFWENQTDVIRLDWQMIDKDFCDEDGKNCVPSSLANVRKLVAAWPN